MGRKLDTNTMSEHCGLVCSLISYLPTVMLINLLYVVSLLLLSLFVLSKWYWWCNMRLRAVAATLLGRSYCIFN